MEWWGRVRSGIVRFYTVERRVGERGSEPEKKEEAEVGDRKAVEVSECLISDVGGRASERAS